MTAHSRWGNKFVPGKSRRAPWSTASLSSHGARGEQPQASFLTSKSEDLPKFLILSNDPKTWTPSLSFPLQDCNCCHDLLSTLFSWKRLIFSEYKVLPKYCQSLSLSAAYTFWNASSVYFFHIKVFQLPRHNQLALRVYLKEIPSYIYAHSDGQWMTELVTRYK